MNKQFSSRAKTSQPIAAVEQAEQLALAAPLLPPTHADPTPSAPPASHTGRIATSTVNIDDGAAGERCMSEVCSCMQRVVMGDASLIVMSI